MAAKGKQRKMYRSADISTPHEALLALPAPRGTGPGSVRADRPRASSATVPAAMELNLSSLLKTGDLNFFLQQLDGAVRNCYVSSGSDAHRTTFGHSRNLTDARYDSQNLVSSRKE